MVSARDEGRDCGHAAGAMRGVAGKTKDARAAIPETAQAKPLDIWFQGEPDKKTVRGTGFPANARAGQQGTLTRVRAKRGTDPGPRRDTRYQCSYIFGAVCPGRAVAAGLILLCAITDAMNAHLTEIARTVAEMARGQGARRAGQHFAAHPAALFT